MDVLYQPSEYAHFKGLTVALGTIDQDIYQFKDFFKDFVLSESNLCAKPNIEDQISIPHSVSYIDFDGDCKPDLLLTRVDSKGQPYFEIYMQMLVNDS